MWAARRGSANGAAAAGLALWVLLSCLSHPARAQLGSDCSDAAPCVGNQQCSLGYCRCSAGFLKHAKDCVPEKSFNETCAFDDQCVDFRLKCSEGRCACVKYFHWDEYSKQCLTYKDLKYMLADMEEKYDSDGHLLLETDQVFTGMLWTGLAVVLVGLILGAGCIFYGCCLGRSCCCPDDKLSDARLLSVHPREKQGSKQIPGSTNSPGRLHRATSQGTGVDYLPGLYESTSFDII